ncbi:MAG: tetratricopeptide repeat protein [Desulfonatronovibrio sp.]
MPHKNKIIILISSTLLLVCAQAAGALDIYWGAHPNHERIVFEFQDQVDEYSVQRTGAQEIVLSLSDDIWDAETRPSEVDFGGSRLINNVRVEDDACIVSTRNSAFGYISFSLDQENKVVIDIFQDPAGRKWPSGIDESAAEPVRPLSEPTTPPSEPAPETIPESDSESESTTEPEPVPAPREVSQRVSQTESDPPDSDTDPGPAYKFRSAIERIAPEDMDAVDDPERVDEAPTSKITARIDSTEKSEEDGEPEESEDQEEEPQEDGDQEAREIEQEPVLHPDLEGAEEASDEYEELIFAARAMMNGGDYRGAVNMFTTLMEDPDLPQEYMEDVLYARAEANFQMLRDDIRGNYNDIITPFERAINYDPASSRLPNALLNLGYINLQVGNEPEARGYFNLIREEYPQHDSVPSTYFYWGDYYLRENRFEEAADSFEQIVEDYPDDQLVKPAAVNLARAFSELDLHEQALDVLEYVNNRWPRHYIDDPDFLTLAGYILYSNDRLDEAKERFLHYINLVPEGDQVDVSMARIGDIYLLQDKNEAAREIYEETVRQFPDEEGGLIAAMRLAEEGIHDEPSISDMFTVFDQPYTLRPEQIYTRISRDYPDSPLAPVALLKLAMWRLFQDEFLETLEVIDEFSSRYAHKELWPRALELGFDTFARLVEDRYQDEEYAEVVELWEKYDYLNQNPDQLDIDTNLALADSYWNIDRLEDALVLARPFLDVTELDEENYGALSLVLGIYLEMRDWNAILELARKAGDWELPREEEMQMDYARALAFQNTGREDEALPLWRDLAVETDFSSKQRAFALFFLAQDAYARQDHEKVYVFAQEALALFMRQEELNQARIRTCLDMLVEATSSTGRMKEALGWALEYENYIEEDDPDWPAVQYRLARMYRLNHQYENWEKVLNDLIQAYPDSVFSRMARSDLNSRSLTTEAEQYNP